MVLIRLKSGLFRLMATAGKTFITIAEFTEYKDTLQELCALKESKTEPAYHQALSWFAQMAIVFIDQFSHELSTDSQHGYYRYAVNSLTEAIEAGGEKSCHLVLAELYAKKGYRGTFDDGDKKISKDEAQAIINTHIEASKPQSNNNTLVYQRDEETDGSGFSTTFFSMHTEDMKERRKALIAFLKEGSAESSNSSKSKKNNGKRERFVVGQEITAEEIIEMVPPKKRPKLDKLIVSKTQGITRETNGSNIASLEQEKIAHQLKAHFSGTLTIPPTLSSWGGYSQLFTGQAKNDHQASRQFYDECRNRLSKRKKID